MTTTTYGQNSRLNCSIRLKSSIRLNQGISVDNSGYPNFLLNFTEESAMLFFFQLPEKLLYSQGCNWIQQYSFGSQRYTGSNILGKLRKCIEALKGQVSE